MVALSETREKIFVDRYSEKDQEGNPTEQTVEQMWDRVSTALAAVETSDAGEWKQRFYGLLEDFKFVPGGRILASAGTGHETTFYNCFVIDSPEDSRHGIYENLKYWADVQSRGGGVGINLSTLRPNGSYIKSVNGFSSGPVNWAELYSVTTGKIIQQGGTRRGAAMIVLDDDHPDVMRFITAKEIDPKTNKPKAIEFANISVAISDEFMKAVEEDGDWQTQFPTKANAKEGDIIKYGEKLKARDIWKAIAESAHKTAEPGVVFMDRANSHSNSWYYLKSRATNPCGEIALAPWHVCNLGAMNLAAYVTGEIGKGEFNYNKLYDDTQLAVRFLDNAVDATHYFMEENEIAQKGIRRIGLGTMGLADALIKMGIRYGSPLSLSVIETFYETIRNAAYEASADLALEKGKAPDYAPAYLDGHFIQTLPISIYEKIQSQGIRNISILCVAPTGTTSMLADVSSGIEPVFSMKTLRKDRLGERIMLHTLAEEWKKNNEGELPDYFVSAHELTPFEHVSVQATVQKYIDQQISKTVNGPATDTVEDIEELYLQAYKLGCKGITYYRDGSRDAVLTAVKEEVAKVEERIRPSTLQGYTSEIVAPEGTAHVTVNSDNGGPREVFLTVGRAGSDLAAMSEAIGRLISLVLRIPSSMTPTERLRAIASQLVGIGGARSIGFGPNRVRSLADAVGQVLSKHQGNLVNTIETKVEPNKDYSISIGGNLCPECNEMTLIYQEGCSKCSSCGFSAC